MHDFLYAWGPLILLVAVWFYFMKKGGALNYKQHVQDMKDLASAQLVEMKRTNEILERLEAIMKDRSQ
ncbi:hypothetical protein [Rubrivivax rivuli]|uniref:hypothetical protein n=1 Tax=Rubrivivax rivuli TaxID=1862385 RepID=UPI000FE3A10D|nr:hypothetical protein [Rubrivivax rivuli]